MTRTTSTATKQRAFALLITMVVVSIVLAVGLSLLNITVKQINLSITGRDSEVAFSAAHASLECVQYTIQRTDLFENEALPNSLDCLNDSIALAQDTDPSDKVSNTTNITEYSFAHTWNNGQQDLCSESDIYIVDARSGQVNANFFGQGVDSVACPLGSVCSVIFARGFNRACNELGSLRTVQRELTIVY